MWSVKIRIVLASLLCLSFTSTAFSQVPRSVLRDRDALMAEMMLDYRGGNDVLAAVTPTVNELVTDCLLRGGYNRSAIGAVKSRVLGLVQNKELNNQQDVMFASQILLRLWEADVSQCRFR